MFTIHPSSLIALPAPQVTITPSGNSTAGSPYTLTCTVMVVNGLVVVPQMTWLKNGTSVVGGNGVLVTYGMVTANTTSLTLKFNPHQTSNGGQYTCIVNVSIPVISITSLYTTLQYTTIVQSKRYTHNKSRVQQSHTHSPSSNHHPHGYPKSNCFKRGQHDSKLW